MTRLLTPLAILLLFAPAAAAHVVPNNQYDRKVYVRLSATGVKITYHLELSPLTLYTASAKVLTPEEIAKIGRTADALVTAYAKKVAPELAQQLRVTVDGARLPLQVKSTTHIRDVNARIEFVFAAEWPAGGTTRAFTFVDESFEGQPGPLTMTLARAGLDDGLVLDITEEPAQGLLGKSPADLSDEQAQSLRRAAATLTLPHPTAAPAETAAESVEVTQTGERPGLIRDLAGRGLQALLDSSLGVGVLLLAAFVFGAAHAFTPGHGKTLVAAYLVGERGTVSHAILLAVATTVAHTGSVIAIAVILWSVYGNHVPGTTQGILQIAGGFLVLLVGLWLLLRRVTGKADHFHVFGGHHHHHHGDGHHHHHDHNHDHHHHHAPPPDAAKSAAGWFRLVLMGLGGGMIPCWDAVLLLLGATALDRIGFAIPLLIAFSAGLGLVLVALGVGVVYAHRAGAVKFKNSRWFALLPVVSAVALTLLGFWLCQEGLRRVTS